MVLIPTVNRIHFNLLKFYRYMYISAHLYILTESSMTVLYWYDISLPPLPASHVL